MRRFSRSTTWASTRASETSLRKVNDGPSALGSEGGFAPGGSSAANRLNAARARTADMRSMNILSVGARRTDLSGAVLSIEGRGNRRFRYHRTGDQDAGEPCRETTD